MSAFLPTSFDLSTGQHRSVIMLKMKCMYYDAEFKLKVIALAEEKGNHRAAFEVAQNESMVRKWQRQCAELNASKKTRNSFPTCSARWPHLEAESADWIHQAVGEH